jgi:hypothetical protein
MIENNSLRALARSTEYQTIYNRAKDLGFELFNNKRNLSKLQVIFLNLLETYSSLYQDIAMGEKYISEEVINDDILCDAYLVYKRKIRKEKKKENKKQNNTNTPSIVFTKGRRK